MPLAVQAWPAGSSNSTGSTAMVNPTGCAAVTVSVRVTVLSATPVALPLMVTWYGPGATVAVTERVRAEVPAVVGESTNVPVIPAGGLSSTSVTAPANPA